MNNDLLNIVEHTYSSHDPGYFTSWKFEHEDSRSAAQDKVTKFLVPHDAVAQSQVWPAVHSDRFVSGPIAGATAVRPYPTQYPTRRAAPEERSVASRTGPDTALVRTTGLRSLWEKPGQRHCAMRPPDDLYKLRNGQRWTQFTTGKNISSSRHEAGEFGFGQWLPRDKWIRFSRTGLY